MILMLDNYDSFTYNLVQYFLVLGQEVKVVRNDELPPEKAEELEFDYLVISPGPSSPAHAGYSMDYIRHFAGKKPILGVCLGHQSIGAVAGANVVRARRVMHGKADLVQHDGKSLFAGLPNPLRVIRYHSLAVERETLPADYEVSATSADGEIMAIRHKTLRIEGVQFHPESIGSEEGMKLLANFLSGVRELPPVRALLRKVAGGTALGEAEAEHLMAMMTEGSVTPAQVGSLLTGLAMRGETEDELTGFARALRAKAVPVPVPDGMDCIDTCGTGGDESGSFNISTTAAFVAAGAGAAVAKHGNRSITSKAGSADVLEALGAKVDLGPADVSRCLAECGIAFMFAPLYHPAFRHIAAPRRELGFRTAFNMLGPLLNPAGVKAQVLGVFDPRLTAKVARVLGRLGSRRALVVHGAGGLDEISLTGTTRICELKDGWVREYEFDPLACGLEYCAPSDLKGGDAAANADILRRVLAGEKGPHRDAVLLNAAAALIVADIAVDFKAGLALARASVDSGAAKARLESFVRVSRTPAGA